MENKINENIENIKSTENNNEKANTSNKQFMIGLVIFFALFIGASIFFIINKKQNLPLSKNDVPENNVLITNKSVTPTETPIPKIYEADVSLKTKTGVNTTNVGNNLVILLSGDSKGSDIISCDIVFAYDSSLFKFISVQTLIPSLQFFPVNKPNKLAISGMKSLGAKNSIVLNNTNMLSVVFEPLKNGAGTISVVDVVNNKEKSQFADSTSKLRMIRPVSLEIEVK